MRQKPVLLAYLNGMPDVESTYPVLARLHQRGKVTVKSFVYSKLLKKEPRLKLSFEHEGLHPVSASKLRMKLMFKRDINAADAVLNIADANWDKTTRRQRNLHVKSIGKQSIFLQHGAYQIGINGAREDEPISFYSQKALFWEPLNSNSCTFTDQSKERIETVGFTKKNILPAKMWPPEVDDWAARYPKRILICQSFRWGDGRYSDDAIGHFYALIDAVLTAHPDTGFIIRSHRGKVRNSHRSLDANLTKNHPNLLISKQYTGPLANASIHDVIDLCDAMISPTSTTVLDCIYSGKPAAVFAEGLSIFPEVPEIADRDTMEAFLANVDAQGPAMQRVKARFGELDTNLDRCAAAIEDHLYAQRPA